MKSIDDILTAINQAEQLGIDTLGTQNVKRWLESIQNENPQLTFKKYQDLIFILTYKSFSTHKNSTKIHFLRDTITNYFNRNNERLIDLDMLFMDMQNDIPNHSVNPFNTIEYKELKKKTIYEIWKVIDELIDNK